MHVGAVWVKEIAAYFCKMSVALLSIIGLFTLSPALPKNWDKTKLNLTVSKTL